jgi:hypothetical protein
MERKEAIDVLQTVYDSLEENYPREDSLMGQIQRLCDSFNCRLSMQGFEFIWKDCDKRRISKD